MENGKSVSIAGLIAVPALITLSVTILRVVGELQHWSPLLFSPKGGGGAALVGISWLPILFGPYFAMKLAGLGEGPSSNGKAIGMSVVGLVVFVACGALVGILFARQSSLVFIPFLLMIVIAFIPGAGWKSLNKTLLVYALAARIPVLVVMFLAMKGNGGTGWGTHYDVVPPAMAAMPFARKFITAAVLPQLTLWIAWTSIVGGLIGSIVVAVAHRGKQATQIAA